MNAGALLKTRRELHGLNQKQLAAMAKTSQGQISRIERGAISPSVSTLEKILKAMGDELRIEAISIPQRRTVLASSSKRRQPTADPLSLLY